MFSGITEHLKFGVDFSSNHTKTQAVNQKIETVVLWSSHMLKRSVNCKSLFTYRFLLPFQFLGRDSLLQLHFHILASGSTPIFTKYFLSFVYTLDASACCGSVHHRASGVQAGGLTLLGVLSRVWRPLFWFSAPADLARRGHFCVCSTAPTVWISPRVSGQRSHSLSWVELYRTSISFSLVILYAVHQQKQKVVWGKKVLCEGHFCWCGYSFVCIPTLSIYVGLCFGKN